MSEPRYLDELSGYFLDRDNDGHWYIVPYERLSEWDAWRAPITPEEDEAGSAPDFAMRLNGHPRRVVFRNYSIRV